MYLALLAIGAPVGLMQTFVIEVSGWPRGLLIPYVLICVSGFLAFRRTSGITRISIVCGLALTAAVLLAPLGIISYLAASTGDEIDRLIIPGGIPNVVALSISGLTAAIGGTWLFATRANHTRSGIDRRHLPPARA